MPGNEHLHAAGERSIGDEVRPRMGTIGVASDNCVPTAVLRAVEELYDLRFVPANEHDPGQLDAVIVFGSSDAVASLWSRAGLRTLAYVGSAAARDSVANECSFTDSPAVPRAFRNAVVRRARPGTSGVAREPRDHVLCLQDGQPVWVRRPVDRTALDLVAADAREMCEVQSLHQLWTSDWLSVVPLLQLAQEVSGWTLPNVRACVMFDDPNLHWRSYGYIDYATLAAHARRFTYHVAFATIPLDAWYVHAPTARIFSENRRVLSLLVHGNDHTHYELHRTRSPRERMRLAAQALRRIDRLERRTGLAVARVMAAPHAACSPAMASSLNEAGYLGASISRGSLVNRNPDVNWPRSVGFSTAEFLGGLPIFPRFNLLADVAVEARLSAMLGQAIVPVGHHEDVRQGLARLEQIAGIINGLGEVAWQDMAAIAASSVHTAQRDDLLLVKAFARRLTVRIPDGSRRLRVLRPWLSTPAHEALTIQTDNGSRPVLADDGTFEVSPGGLVTICSTGNTFDYRTAPPRRSSLRAVVRRQLAESRDRLRPYVDGAVRAFTRSAS